MEKLHISKLVEQSTSYKEGKVLKTIQSDQMTVFLVDGREKRPINDVSSISEFKKEICPYCQEAIPCAHLGEISDWHITGNKYPGTNIEVIGVSKEHSPHLKNTDFRAWMHMATTTNATLIYSPARKSLPGHKHIQLLDFKIPQLSQEEVKWIDKNVGYTYNYKYKVIVIQGDFESRLGNTVSILRKLYIKEHMYNIVVAPEKTYILPSKIVGKMLDARVFVGIISTTNKDLFEKIKEKIDNNEVSSIITDYSDCNYEEDEIKDLLNPNNNKIPNTEEVQNELKILDADPGGILALGENHIVAGLSLANDLNIEFQSCSFAFTTDKKSNFFADCTPPTFQNLKNKDLLIVVDKLTKNIEDYVIQLMEHYKVPKLYVISNLNKKEYNLEKISRKDVNRAIVPSQIKINADSTKEAEKNVFLKNQIENLKKKCDANTLFVEMVIGLDVKNIENISTLQKEFLSASFKIMPFGENQENWKSIDEYVRHNIQPALRDFNPTTSKLLEYVADNYQDIITSQPKHKCEEGIIVLYIDNIDLITKREIYQDLINELAINTGRKIEVISNKKSDSLLEVTRQISLNEFKSLKPGSEVVILAKNVIKKIEVNELEAYMLLRRYSDRLHDEKIKILVPELLNYDQKSKQSLLSKIGNFSIYSPQEYFGLTNIYNIDYYKNLYKAAEIIRNNIPKKEVFNQTDHDLGSDTNISPVLQTIKNDRHGDETSQMLKMSQEVERMINETQDLVKKLPLYASHRDPNPNNYQIIIKGDEVSVSLVDWEKFGLSRKGYEEGMFMSLLALDVQKQNDYIEFITKQFYSLENLYFWRTVATRTLHEMHSVFHGLYDARILSTVKNIDEVKLSKDRLTKAFENLLNKALKEIIIIKQNEL